MAANCFRSLPLTAKRIAILEFAILVQLDADLLSRELRLGGASQGSSDCVILAVSAEAIRIRSYSDDSTVGHLTTTSARLARPGVDRESSRYILERLPPDLV